MSHDVASQVVSAQEQALGKRVYGFLRAIPTWVLWVIVLLWTLPSFSLFVNSFRDQDQQRSGGFWTAFTDFDLTLSNYTDVLASGAGSPGGGLWEATLNSLAIAVPSTIIPIAIAAFAAYAFAWMDFRGREWLFIGVVSLLAVPSQVSLIPLLQTFAGGAHWTIPVVNKTVTIFPDWNMAGEFMSVWISHTGFALPFAIFLLHNYISSLPTDLFESARIDGADHFKIFFRLVLPLSVPVLAAFAIFQFLWTWNDYLIAVTMIGADITNLPITVRIASLAGEFGLREHLLTSGAFISMILPIVVFFALQRYFVRGILAGSVKG